MSAAVILAEALLPSFEDGPAARSPLDLGLEAGRVVCLLGPTRDDNRAWMRALAAVEPPARGRLRHDGDDVWSLDEAAWIRLRTRVAYIAPGVPLVSVNDALANLMLPALYHRLGDYDAVRSRALSLLRRVGWNADPALLPAYLDAYHRCLLALARCLILEPSFLFIDAPLSFEDVVQQKSVERLCASLAAREGIGVVVRTHNIAFTHEHSDLVLYANHRGLHRYATWDEFVSRRKESIAQYDMQ